MTSKGQSRAVKTVESGLSSSDTNGQKLTQSIIQEFQNLKDKFKNEDDLQEKGNIICCYY